LRLNMQLVDIRILTIEFHLNKDFREEKDRLTFNTDIAIRNDFIEENNELFVFVKLKQKSGNVPFFFEIEGGGRFKFDKTPDKKTLDAFATINCPAIIFPYIRETIADITRRAGFPPLHIGPVNFIELSKTRKKETAKRKQ